MLTDTAIAALLTTFAPIKKRGKVIGTYTINGLDAWGRPLSPETIEVRENDTALTKQAYSVVRGHFRPSP